MTVYSQNGYSANDRPGNDHEVGRRTGGGLVMACTSGCVTKDCGSYADCLRGKTVRVAYCNSAGGWDYTKQKKWDSELAAYRGAVAEGLDPQGTTMRDVEKAKKIADTVGSAV